MAGRIRSIKPEILDDEGASGLSDAAWRLWVSTWVLADDSGNCRAGDRYLAAQVWQDTSRAASVPDLLKELSDKRRLEIYENGGERYAHIRNWKKHQRIDNAGKPRFPGPDHEKSATCPGFRREPPEPRGELPETRGEPPLHSGDSRLDLRSPTSDHRPPTPISHARARVDTPKQEDGSLSAQDLRSLWAEKTRIQFPDASGILAIRDRLRDYATASGEDPQELARRALEAFGAESGGWSNPQALSTDLFLRKWERIQARMAGGVPRASPPGKARGREPPRYQDEDEVRRSREAASRGEE